MSATLPEIKRRFNLGNLACFRAKGQGRVRAASRTRYGTVGQASRQANRASCACAIGLSHPRRFRSGCRCRMVPGRHKESSSFVTLPLLPAPRLPPLYSVQPKVSIWVDGATEMGTKISQSEAAAANVRVMPEPAGTR